MNKNIYHWQYGYILGVTVICYYLWRLIREKKYLKQELSRTKNESLKAQINPHFLFNTLDYIYHNISLENPVAADALITLSEMMRYAIDAVDSNELITLGAEIEQVEKLVYLHQLRKNHALNVTIEIDDELRSMRFIPMVLLSLVENIFKHGNTLDKTNGAVMSVLAETHHLLIRTSNPKNMKPVHNSTGSGLKNIKKRLHYAYGDTFDFHITEDDNFFSVVLRVPFTLNLSSAKKE